MHVAVEANGSRTRVCLNIVPTAYTTRQFNPMCLPLFDPFVCQRGNDVREQSAVVVVVVGCCHRRHRGFTILQYIPGR